MKTHVEQGANDLMARPFPPVVLQARVRNLLRQRRDAAAVELARRSAWQRLGDAQGRVTALRLNARAGVR